jgi:hypothetical protein
MSEASLFDTTPPRLRRFGGGFHESALGFWLLYDMDGSGSYILRQVHTTFATTQAPPAACYSLPALSRCRGSLRL